MIVLGAALFGMVLSGSVAFAQALQVKSSSKGEKVPWRGSALTYITTVSALSFAQNGQNSYDPYYGMSLMFMPRWWFTDNLYARLLFTLDIELTEANNQNGSRRLTMSDTFFDWVWTDKRLTIPVAKIRVTPSLRFLLPTSSWLYNRNLILGIGPGLALSRGFKLRKGKWFSGLSVSASTRVIKEFHRYNTASINGDKCTFSPTAGADFGGCSQTGGLNRSWRFLNAVSLGVQIHPKWSFGMTAFFINDVTYGMKGTESLPNNPNISVPEAGAFFRPFSIWSMMSVTYTAASWAYIGLGVQSFHSIRKPNTDFRQPLFNNATSFYLSFTVPIAQAIKAAFGSNDSTKKKVSKSDNKDQTRPQS
ncbi:MAG: hypothetical protein KC503_16960 [Myxococcales bacterium]|nr:hypothetical protein [Myxococcales bacterium]